MSSRLSSLGWALLGLVLLWSPKARAQVADSECSANYTFGFFNGVWNTRAQALSGLGALRDAFHEANGSQKDIYDKEKVFFRLFYNRTGSSVGSGGLQDIAEVFVQRARELDPSGTLAERFAYFFWRPVVGTGPGYADSVASRDPLLNNMLVSFSSEVCTLAASKLSQMCSQPPTEEDYWAHRVALGDADDEGHKLLLVAHSQGNLFVNPAYDYIQPLVGSARVRAVHIAPASPTVSGQYTLADIDLVINGLVLVNGPGSVPASNLTLATSFSDPSGHTLIGTYLDGNRPGRGTIQDLLLKGMAAMDTTHCGVIIDPDSSMVNPGDEVQLSAQYTPPSDPTVVVTNRWSITGDLGGHLLDPATALQVETLDTTGPTITYVAPGEMYGGTQDLVSLAVYLSSTGDTPPGKVVGRASATVSSNPWTGTWTTTELPFSDYYSAIVIESTGGLNLSVTWLRAPESTESTQTYTGFYLPQGLTTQGCVNDGGTSFTHPDVMWCGLGGPGGDQSPMSVSGDTLTYINQDCPIGCVFTRRPLTDCGNGACESWEDATTCPDDCEQGQGGAGGAGGSAGQGGAESSAGQGGAGG